jgi:hypothetical protein
MYFDLDTQGMVSIMRKCNDLFITAEKVICIHD